jgi:hypothetical protein
LDLETEPEDQGAAANAGESWRDAGPFDGTSGQPEHDRGAMPLLFREPAAEQPTRQWQARTRRQACRATARRRHEQQRQRSGCITEPFDDPGGHQDPHLARQMTTGVLYFDSHDVATVATGMTGQMLFDSHVTNLETTVVLVNLPHPRPRRRARAHRA